MREQKYAHVLDDDSERKQQDNIEEQLSMTRELKFQNVQDESLDNDEVIEKSYMTRQIRYQKVQDDIDQTKVKKDFGFKDRDIEKTKPQVIDDDIYLTTSFKPLKKRFRLKKVFKILFIFIFLGCLGGAFYFFIGLPVYNKVMKMMPQEIFHSSINAVRDYTISFLEDDLISDKEYLDMQIGINSNIEDIDVFNNYKFGVTQGIDAVNKKYEFGTYVLKDETKYGYSIMADDKYTYFNFWNLDTILKYDSDEYEVSDELNKFYKEAKESFDTMGCLTREEKEYLVNTVARELNNLITRDNVKVEKDELSIMGNTKSVIKNTLAFNKDSLEQFEKDLFDNLKNDSKFVEILKKYWGVETDEKLDELFEIDDFEEDFKLEFNIYTEKGTDFVGFDIVEDGFRSFYYYVDGENFNLHINLTSAADLCTEGQDCSLDTQEVYDFTGTVEDNHKKIVVTRNGLDFVTIILREFSKEKIDFDLELMLDSDTQEDDNDESEDSGSLDMDEMSDEKESTSTEKEKYIISVNIDMTSEMFNGKINIKNEKDEYITINLDMEISGSKEIAVIDETKVVSYSEEKAEALADDFAMILDKNEALGAFYVWDEYVDQCLEYLEYLDSYNYFNNSSGGEVTTV